MKILIVAPYFYPKVGGMENYVYNIAVRLTKQFHHTIVVVTSNHHSSDLLIESIENLKIYRLPALFTISNTPINPIWIINLYKIIKVEKPDLINAHTPVPFISDIAALLSGKIPFVLTHHAASLYKKNNLLFNILIFLYVFLVEARTLKKSTKIIAESKAVRKKFAIQYGEKTITINNSISESEINNCQINPNESKKLIFISSLDKTHRWKGLEDIISAVSICKKQYGTTVQLTVIGDGNYLKEYTELAERLGVKENVLFKGVVQGEAKRKLIYENGVLITYPNTSNDAFPTVFLEAWANCAAVISSNIFPINYILKNNHTAILAEQNNSEELAKSICRVISQNSLRNALIRNGHNEVKKYTWELQTQKTHELFINIKNAS